MKRLAVAVALVAPSLASYFVHAAPVSPAKPQVQSKSHNDDVIHIEALVFQRLIKHAPKLGKDNLAFLRLWQPFGESIDATDDQHPYHFIDPALMVKRLVGSAPYVQMWSSAGAFKKGWLQRHHNVKPNPEIYGGVALGITSIKWNTPQSVEVEGNFWSNPVGDSGNRRIELHHFLLNQQKGVWRVAAENMIEFTEEESSTEEN